MACSKPVTCDKPGAVRRRLGSKCYPHTISASADKSGNTDFGNARESTCRILRKRSWHSSLKLSTRTRSLVSFGATIFSMSLAYHQSPLYVFSDPESPDPKLNLCQSIDFVIPDACLTAGMRTLVGLKSLTPCPDLEVCSISSQDRYTPPPAFHTHIKDSEVIVSLYSQSETIWFLPPLDDSLLCPTKLNLPSHFALASDHTILLPWRPGRGSGVFQSDQNPVVVLKPHALLEAFLRLYARDEGKRVSAFAIAMIAYVEGYIDDAGLLDASLLPEPLKTSYQELREGKKPVLQWTNELKEALGIPEVSEEDCSC